MDWLVVVCIIAVVAFLTYGLTVITGLFKRNIDITQDVIDEADRQQQIQEGVVVNNAKADNAKSGSDLDKRVMEKYGDHK